MAGGLTALSDERLDTVPHGVAWAHVGAPCGYLDVLRRVTDAAIQDGAHCHCTAGNCRSRPGYLFGMKTQLNDLPGPFLRACVCRHHSGVTTMLDTLPYADLLAIYNAVAEKPVTRFDTRANGVRRTAALMEERGRRGFAGPRRCSGVD
jgi:hypothetical protein